MSADSRDPLRVENEALRLKFQGAMQHMRRAGLRAQLWREAATALRRNNWDQGNLDLYERAERFEHGEFNPALNSNEKEQIT